MKLKKLLESTPGFENRKFGDKLPTLDSVKSAYQSAKGINEQSEPIDYAYFIEQTNGLLTAMEDFQQELSTALEAKDEETGDPQYQQLQNQVARYMQGAEKQVAAMGKMLNRKQDLTNRDTFTV
jgi:hypothetical protein